MVKWWPISDGVQWRLTGEIMGFLERDPLALEWSIDGLFVFRCNWHLSGEIIAYPDRVHWRLNSQNVAISVGSIAACAVNIWPIGMGSIGL